VQLHFQPPIRISNLVSVHRVNITFICSVGPCHREMAGPRVADQGEGHQIWKVAGCIDQQLRKADKGLSSSLGLEGGAKICSL